jgi:hypothetical protein
MVTPEMIQPLDALDPKLQPNIPIEGLAPGLLPNGLPGHPTDRKPGPPIKDRKDLFRMKPAAPSR